jgi:hypothetical protein
MGRGIHSFLMSVTGILGATVPLTETFIRDSIGIGVVESLNDTWYRIQYPS